MPRRPVLAVAACLVLAACGAPHGTATLDHEPDLAGITRGSTPAGLRSEIARDVDRLRQSCAEIDPTVRAALRGTVGGPDVNPPRLTLEDAQCHWASASAGAPQLVVGIVNGGAYRFHETAKLLKDEQTVGHIGDGALYDPHSRALFVLWNGRLWYVQLVGDPATGDDARQVLTTIAKALVS
jgi:hypothetical protein